MGNKWKEKCKHIILSVLWAAMTLMITACGKQDDEYVYVPEYTTLQAKEADYVDFFGTKVFAAGDWVYYKQELLNTKTQLAESVFCRYSLKDGSVEPVSIPLDKDKLRKGNYAADAEGNLYAALVTFDTDENGKESRSVKVGKYDAKGEVVFEKDIADILNRNSISVDRGIARIWVDGRKCIYIWVDDVVILLTEDGSEQGVVSPGEHTNILNLGQGRDGNIYICYSEETSAPGEAILAVIDFEEAALGEGIENFPGVSSRPLLPGDDKDLLYYDSKSVYQYDCESQNLEEVLEWVDCDIDGGYVLYVGATENGDLFAVVAWWDDAVGIYRLKKEKASQVTPKKEIVVATLYENGELRQSAVEFNRKSDTHRVIIRTYIEDGNDEISYEDALAKLNTDIVSGTNCPDMLELSKLNIEQLAAKGILMDLTPYLEQSSVISKEDFFEGLLEDFVYDGALITLPVSISRIETMVGKTSILGEEPGWTLDELIAFADAHPDAKLFAGSVDKLDLLKDCMLFHQDTFIDWTAGKCYFDSEEFRSLLEFVNRFQEEKEQTTVDMTELLFAQSEGVAVRQAGGILLDRSYVNSYIALQVDEGIYGEPVTYIGYPTADGSPGYPMYMGTMFGVLEKSDDKDGAWAFMESYATGEASRYHGNISALKERELAEIERYSGLGGGTIIGDYNIEYHPATQDEIALLEELIALAKPVNTGGTDAIITILSEEAPSYFQGQKSIDEVVAIIQNRAQIYVSENE